MIEVEQVKQNIRMYSSEKLTEMIVANRYLRILPEICLLAMEELSRRRSEGDAFLFEKHIAEGLASLPKLDFSQEMGLSSFLEVLRKVKK